MLAAVISTLPLFLIATGVLAAPMDLESRDADGNKLPVVHLSKFDCREYNKGNPKYSLCATDKNRAFPKKNKCTALAKSWADGPNQVQPTEWGTYGYTGDSDCAFEGYNHNDPASARGLVNMTFDTTTMGAWIKEQSEACFSEGSPFNYAHCSISDPMAFFFLFSTDPAPDSA